MLGRDVMEEIDERLKKAPYAVVILRFFFTPLFFYAFILDVTVIAIILYVTSFTSDIADGILAKRLKTTSTSLIEAYLDPLADFAFVFVSFFAFTLRGIYPFWILTLIIFMFALFIATSKDKRPLYDPVGKYYGTFLITAIGITILIPNQLVFEYTLLFIVGYTLILAIYRIAFVWKNGEKKQKVNNEMKTKRAIMWG